MMSKELSQQLLVYVISMLAKRLFDLISSISAILLLLPVFLCIALLVHFTSKGGILFRQTRVGLNGRKFTIFKFRTMIISDSKVQLSNDKDSRITRVGGFLRKWKLDELPQFINVLIGDMSLVGPRPEVPEYVKHYDPDTVDKILSVKPGITDNASIYFRNESTILSEVEDINKTYIEEILPIKQKYFLEYVNNRSFKLDLYILFKTAYTIIFK